MDLDFIEKKKNVFYLSGASHAQGNSVDINYANWLDQRTPFEQLFRNDNGNITNVSSAFSIITRIRYYLSNLENN